MLSALNLGQTRERFMLLLLHRRRKGQDPSDWRLGSMTKFYTNVTERSTKDFGDDGARGFSFLPTVIFPSTLLWAMLTSLEPLSLAKVMTEYQDAWMGL
jgi:hypothetical protein